MNKPDSGAIARFVFRVEFIPYVVFTAIGAAVLYTLGTIAMGAMQNGSLIPPPAKLERYDCSAPFGSFSIVFSQGTDRVKIKSMNGALDGTVQQNRFDWQGFGNDRNLLGFAPPTEMAGADGKTLRLSGVDLKDVVCNVNLEPPAQARVVVQ